MPEFDLIAEIAAHVTPRSDVLTGIGDDCALLQPPLGQLLAFSTDTLVAGVHFYADAEPYLIGYKALAVNLSDLAAMGAKPLWYSLNLTLPAPNRPFVRELVRGMQTLSVEHGIGLIGGDTTRGPFSMTLSVIGAVAPGRALLRSGARSGDGIYVSGALGDAAGALTLRERARSGTPSASELAPPWLAQRMDQPSPRVALGQALVGIASSAIDISDGLVADLAHICNQSRCSATILLERLPLSHELVLALGLSGAQQCALSGGDDYELCFTAADFYAEPLAVLASHLNIAITRIGTIGAAPAQHVEVLDANGTPIALERRGYAHFG
jgi:thiamine-monophosphate kinase